MAILASIPGYSSRKIPVNNHDKKMLVFNAVLCAIILILGCIYKYIPYFRFRYLIIIAELLYVSMLISLMILFVIMPIYYFLKFILHWKQELMDDLVCEVSYDHTCVSRLACYENHELACVKRCLQQKIERRNLRISLLFGDKTAIVTLFGIGYAAIHALAGDWTLIPSLIANASHDDYRSFGIMLLLGGLFGIIIGAIWLRNFVMHLEYLHYLVTQAIESKGVVSSLRP